MIFLTRLDGKEVVVNDDLLLFIESTPDTVLTFTTGLRLMVKEPVEEVVARTARYRQGLSVQGPQIVPSPAPTPEIPPPADPTKLD